MTSGTPDGQPGMQTLNNLAPVYCGSATNSCNGGTASNECGWQTFTQAEDDPDYCCAPSGYPVNEGCCNGLIPLSNGTCGACIANGQHANSPGDCCSNETDNSGTCVPCVPLGNFCVYDSDCCSQLCENYACVSCLPGGASCSQDTDCCGQWCSDGLCGTGDYCIPQGGYCGGDLDCCSQDCQGGLCQ